MSSVQATGDVCLSTYRVYQLSLSLSLSLYIYIYIMHVIMYEDSQLFDSWASIDTGSLCMVKDDCPVVPSELSI